MGIGDRSTFNDRQSVEKIYEGAQNFVPCKFVTDFKWNNETLLVPVIGLKWCTRLFCT